ncbi:hypothetical protein [Pandoraea sputorum]|uniref:hypothetical protein n=1 Tax=Pandoraea sputorum TaxID=93222 RepID=UPI00123F89F3|nr:hypothetical protein [Pandoraea sputorum]
MPSINYVYRGCHVAIEIGERATLWDITIEVTPFDGVELLAPIGPHKLKMAKTERLDAMQSELIREIQLAIDRRLVGC